MLLAGGRARLFLAASELQDIPESNRATIELHPFFAEWRIRLLVVVTAVTTTFSIVKIAIFKELVRS
jgi:hypothetical protein